MFHEKRQSLCNTGITRGLNTRFIQYGLDDSPYLLTMWNTITCLMAIQFCATEEIWTSKENGAACSEHDVDHLDYDCWANICRIFLFPGEFYHQ
jgi:hypothetical protein